MRDQAIDVPSIFQIKESFSLIFFVCKFLQIIHVAAGSPGPFDKKIPSGLSFKIVSKELSAGTTVTLQPKLEKFLKMFFLIP